MRAIAPFVTAFLFASALVAAAQTGTAAEKRQAPQKAASKAPATAVSKADSSAGVQKTSAAPDSAAHVPETDATTSAAVDSTEAKEDPLAYTRPVFTYDPGGKRDPFNSLVPRESKEEKKIKGLFNYEKATLKGIVNTDRGACALVVDGDGYSHVLRKNDRVFGGFVTDITDGAVYLHIVQYGRSMTIILRMETVRQTVRASDQGLSVMKRPGIDLSFGPATGSGDIVPVEDVVVPSLETRTVEDIWFGPVSGESAPSGESGVSTLIAPPDSAVVLLPQVFRWTRAEGDSLYTVVFSEDREFTTQLVVREGLTGTNCLLDRDAGLEPGKQYYWKVIALKRSGKWINSRNHLSFMITEPSDRGTDNEKK